MTSTARVAEQDAQIESLTAQLAGATAKKPKGQ